MNKRQGYRKQSNLSRKPQTIFFIYSFRNFATLWWHFFHLLPPEQVVRRFPSNNREANEQTENCFRLHDWSGRCVYRFRRTTKPKKIPRLQKANEFSQSPKLPLWSTAFTCWGDLWRLVDSFACFSGLGFCSWWGSLGYFLLRDCAGAAEDHMKCKTRWWCLLCLFPVFWNCLENVYGVGAVVWTCSCDVSSLWFF